MPERKRDDDGKDEEMTDRGPSPVHSEEPEGDMAQTRLRDSPAPDDIRDLRRPSSVASGTPPPGVPPRIQLPLDTAKIGSHTGATSGAGSSRASSSRRPSSGSGSRSSRLQLNPRTVGGANTVHLQKQYYRLLLSHISQAFGLLSQQAAEQVLREHGVQDVQKQQGSREYVPSLASYVCFSVLTSPR